MLNLPVYLDNNATTRMDDLVLEEMLPYFTKHYGNAASHSHPYGWEAEEAVEFAREQVARLINAIPKEIIFTSGATEAINLALKGVAEMYVAKGNHIITVKTEHKAVQDSCTHLESTGCEITYLPVNKEGLISVEELENAIKPNTILISIMYGNNETGTIQPIKEISALAKKNGILFFTDATQAIGKIPVDVIEDGIDLMAFSAHKMYGPKGTGALYIRRKDPRVRVVAQIDGGGHERGMRSGTLNVPGIAGFGKACEISKWKMEEDGKRIKKLRNKLENELLKIEGVVLNGHPDLRLPNVVNVSFTQNEDANLLIQLNKNISVSAGSACTSSSLEPSYVLKAMYGNDELAKSAIRFSLGRFTTEEEIDYAIDYVKDTVNSMEKSLTE
ncbi:MAG: IscS subfamily cysteine desulfurase [Ginsengibacter sp.]